MSTRAVLRSSFEGFLQTLTVGVVLLGLVTSIWEPAAWASDSAAAPTPVTAASDATSAPARADKVSKPAPPPDFPNARQQEGPEQGQPASSLKAADQLLQSQGLVFIENRGQFDSRVKFLVRGNGANLWLTNEGIVFDFQRPVAKQAAEKDDSTQPPSPGRARLDPRMKPDPPAMERLVFTQKLVGGSPNPIIETRDPQPGIYNYFVGSDPNKWRTHVLAYKEVLYRDVWKGIDVKLSANGPNLDEEFIVHPGADPSAVRLAYEGINGLSVADDGSLKVATAFGDVIETSPRIYQEHLGNEVPVGGKFRVAGNAYSFEVAQRDERSDLVIDPTVIFSKPRHGRKASQGTLLYSTYLGGSGTCIGEQCPFDYAREPLNNHNQ